MRNRNSGVGVMASAMQSSERQIPVLPYTFEQIMNFLSVLTKIEQIELVEVEKTACNDYVPKSRMK